jgi:hypothetical protein
MANSRGLHRFLGLSLVLPLVLWTATGLLFHVKHRYAEAYETLRVPMPPTPDLSTFTVPPARATAGGVFDRDCVPRFAIRPDGRGGWFGKKNGRGVAVDAASGDLLAEAPEKISLEWAKAAVAVSPHAARYGKVEFLSSSKRSSPLTLSNDPSLDLSFSGGKTVTVDRLTGEIVQSGALNDWIDLTYRVHFLQWTPWKPVNVALEVFSIPLVLGLAVSGLLMAFRRGRIGT